MFIEQLIDLIETNKQTNIEDYKLKIKINNLINNTFITTYQLDDYIKHIHDNLNQYEYYSLLKAILLKHNYIESFKYCCIVLLSKYDFVTRETLNNDILKHIVSKELLHLLDDYLKYEYSIDYIKQMLDICFTTNKNIEIAIKLVDYCLSKA